ncbi:MAG: hypothetical protein M3Q58_06800 [Bacteroidota bacterium]|nr:hypothetical protein [Bacteroidota bacterium]
MAGNNLFFNILTFDWPETNIDFYFHIEEQEKFPRLHHSIFPLSLASIFPSIPASQDFIATTYKGKVDGFTPLSIDFKTENPNLIKQYYNRQINYYFRKVNPQILKTTFIKENQVWVHQPKLSNEVFDVYDKFTLSIQLAEVSQYPELLLSFDGKSKILKRSIADAIQDIEPENFKWVLVDNKLAKYIDLAKWDDVDYNNVYPVVNKNLSIILNFAVALPPRDNRYKSYLLKIEEFYKSHLDNDQFKEFIPLHKDGFIKVPTINIDETDADCNKLSFGKKTGEHGFDIVPNNGMKLHGPFKKSPFNKVQLFYIMHEDDKGKSLLINNYLTRGFGFFKGLLQYVDVLLHTSQGFSIIFKNKENPVIEIDEELSKRAFDPDTQYIAIYITPYSKYENDLEKREIYYKIKEVLLKRNITSQTIDPAKLKENDPNYVYSLPNIAVAILAKLGGIPWRLNTPVKNELVIGVGAFKHVATDVQYIGSAFSFSNTGNFNRFEYFMKHEIDILAGSISRAIREFSTVNDKPERLIIHFYKTMSDRELKPIQKALEEISLDIPIFIVSINKTESEDIVVFDKGWDELMPKSGTYINIGKSKYLLCNNTRYIGTTHSKADGYPFPIKLKIVCTDKTQLQETKVTKELIEQVYQFSRMYWKSVRQQNLPVTIKYPEMVAQIAPHFDGGEIPAFGKDNLWFL